MCSSRRIQTPRSPATNAYTHNALNQLVGRDVPIATTNTTEIQYFWGMDLSETLQGAGGVGGLLAVSCNGSFYFPAYDNNGNVTKYIDENGSVVAAYEYDDFGRIIFQSGALADFFRIRFSTKYFDSETGLYYYGYRFYLPTLMRWLNRDPIEESGGLNLYGFALNAPICSIDALGRERLTMSYDFATDTNFLERMLNWSTRTGMTVDDAVGDITKRVKPYDKSGKGKCKCIEKITLAGHGYDGDITLGKGNNNVLAGSYLHMWRENKSSRNIPYEIMSLLEKIRSLACDKMTVEFATCFSGRGEAGADLRSQLEMFFGTNTNIILYDREIRFVFNRVY